MKNKFLNISILIVSLFVHTLLAQTNNPEEITIPLSNPGKTGTLKVNLVEGSIVVEGYSGKEIIISSIAKSENKEKELKEKDGMKRISYSGGDLDISESNNVVDVQASHHWVVLKIKVPAQFNLKLNTVNNGEITVKNVSGEIEVENVNKGINLKDISGSVSANTVNGSVIVDFNKITPGVPMAFTTLNGKIDITLPPDTKATLKIKSDQGEIYSDFDMNTIQLKDQKKSTENGYYKLKTENWVEGTINGGGPQFLMKNMNGNIYIRKKK